MDSRSLGPRYAGYQSLPLQRRHGARRAEGHQFCYIQLLGTRAPDDQTCIQTLANIYYRAIYSEEGR